MSVPHRTIGKLVLSVGAQVLREMKAAGGALAYVSRALADCGLVPVPEAPGVLGLALTRKVMERLGGTASALGVVDGGCTVQLTLPKSNP